MHALERPVWATLSTYHEALSEGTALARRFAPQVNVFASARDDSPAALAALAALVRPNESVYLLQASPLVIPPGLCVATQREGVQMLASHAQRAAAPDAEIVVLDDTDASQMQALAHLTQPGPFLKRTHTMGRFRGVRIGGRLAAMAGERMRFPGYTEVSGVCVHPDFRGRGLARRLSGAVVADIEARGERAFLHAYKTNRAAIALYQALGFELRAEVNVAELRRCT